MKNPFNPFFVGLCLIVAISNCKKDTAPAANTTSPINFDSLAVGQTSQYLGWAGSGYYDNDFNNFNYFDDTLSMTIVEKNANGYRVKESLSYVGDVNNQLKNEQDSVYYYYLHIANDTLFATPDDGKSLVRSFMLHGPWLGSLKWPLSDIVSNNLDITGYKTNAPYCECYSEGFAENPVLLGTTYDRLNVVINDKQMALDGDGSTYLFGRKYGFVRVSSVGYWAQECVGWDLLP